MIKLTVFLEGGRTLSGSYDYIGVLARLQFAQGLDGYLGFDLDGDI